jgi:hypothetical protein
LFRIEPENDLSVSCVFTLVADERSAVRDNAGRALLHFPFHFQRSAGVDAVLEVAREWRKDQARYGLHVASAVLVLVGKFSIAGGMEAGD